MMNTGSPTLFLQSFRARKEHLWFLVASFLDFVAGEIGKMPLGFVEIFPVILAYGKLGLKEAIPKERGPAAVNLHVQ